MIPTPGSSTDKLTGLLTRKAFSDLFDEALEIHKAGDVPLSLAFIDIDHFMQINETYGHAAGDEVLVTLASVLRECGGSNAAVCRYGGDEFMILLPDTEREQAFLLIEKLRSDMTQRAFDFKNDQEQLDGISISAGIASAPIDGRLKSELFRKVDQALYRAKATGRGKVRLAYDERMVPKTSHYTQTQLERLSNLAVERQAGEAELLREALDDLIAKYGVNEIER
ncbi:protein containg diguanylate cyclase (GGDEF) domain [Longilinea arvoryzae]|uniref:Protein containg diguanylate cyclase (GGDEF) domain n=1 Tax=Longilinea arvoryzae TaxID=360412 RepID=A0A0S7BHH8_9CHLR|nr:GGDEF domain-containing protein [Longilinea arvoryzae]GAP13958.1 protein containg diguanylate cyclase (GGDEF) domain [Longilinea arvoryzae]